MYNKIPHPQADDEDLQWQFLQHLPIVFNGERFLEMDAPLTIGELYNSLSCMGTGKAPGTDGLTIEFLQQNFGIKLISYCFASINYSLKQGNLTTSQTRGLVRLIPKKNKQLEYVRNWRPITLLNVDYKIFVQGISYAIISLAIRNGP